MRKIVVVVLGLVVGLSACGGGGGSDAASTTTSGVAAPTTTAAPTSTTAAGPTTTMDTTPVTPAQLYGEMDKEIQRACGKAVTSGRAPEATFDVRWAELSTEAKLEAAVDKCVAARKAEATPTTTTG